VTELRDSRPIRRRLLVVDDSPIFLELESTFLSRIGRVTIARTAKEALELAQRERPDVVIADLHMPEIPGDILCRNLKSDPDLARTPVILVTGHNHAEDHERAVRAGADDVVNKPINRLQLIQAVNRFLKLAVRGLVRVSLEADVCVDRGGQQVWGRARNVSRGGMFIESEITPDPSTELELDFKLPDSNRPISPTAQVVWRRSARSGSASGIGVRFLKLDPDASREIDDFVYERADGDYDAPPVSVMPVR